MKNKHMTGWKVWAAGGLSIFYGIVGFVLGLHDASTMMGFIVAGLGAVGFGHKIEKAKNSF